MRQSQSILVPRPWLAGVVVCFFIARFPYRWIVRATGMDDWGLFGVLPSFFFALALPLFGARWRSDPAALRMFCIFPLIYELSQLEVVRATAPWIIPMQRTFDIWDIIASLFGSSCALLCLRNAVQLRQQCKLSPNKTMEPTR